MSQKWVQTRKMCWNLRGWLACTKNQPKLEVKTLCKALLLRLHLHRNQTLWTSSSPQNRIHWVTTLWNCVTQNLKLPAELHQTVVQSSIGTPNQFPHLPQTCKPVTKRFPAHSAILSQQVIFSFFLSLIDVQKNRSWIMSKMFPFGWISTFPNPRCEQYSNLLAIIQSQRKNWQFTRQKLQRHVNGLKQAFRVSPPTFRQDAWDNLFTVSCEVAQNACN